MAKRNILVFNVQPLVDVRTNLMFSTRVSDADGNVSYKDEQSITFTMRDSEGRDRPRIVLRGLSSRFAFAKPGRPPGPDRSSSTYSRGRIG